VILYSIHPFWFCLYLQYEQIHMVRNTSQFFKNLLHGERGQDIYYNGFTFCSITRKLFLMQSSYHWGWTIHGLKGMVVFFCKVCKQSFGFNMFTLIDYSFFGKKTLLFYCNFQVLQQMRVLFSWYVAVYQNDLHALLKTVICKWSTALFPLVDLLKMGTLLLNSQ
jgi:hypothetical protein